MLSQVFSFFIGTIHKFFSLLTRFEFDNNITLYSIALFLIFARLVFFMVEYLKSVMTTLQEHDERNYRFDRMQDYYDKRRRRK